MLLCALAGGLAGCKGGGPLGSGVGLYHDLQGGVIAQQRPPPPGVDDPFPNLAAIPKRPAAPDIVAQQRIADRLATQRDQAEQAAAANPLTPRPPPPAPPKPAASPDPNANRVVVDAAPAPPPKPASPPPAAAPAPQATPAPAAIPTLASVPAVPAPAVSGPLPSLAGAPPPGPVGLGVPSGGPSVAVAAAAPASPAASPVAAAAANPAAPKPLLDRLLSDTAVPIPKGDTVFTPPPIPATGNVAIAFTPGSAELPPSATLNLRRFALAHRGVPVTITGHGDAVLPGAEAQSRALDLALRRAQAIAASLATAGIPAANLRLHAEATGHGGLASL